MLSTVFAYRGLERAEGFLFGIESLCYRMRMHSRRFCRGAHDLFVFCIAQKFVSFNQLVCSEAVIKLRTRST